MTEPTSVTLTGDFVSTPNPSAQDFIVVHGGAVKSIGEYDDGSFDIEGRMVTFTTESIRDLTDEYFDQSTDFMEALYPLTGVTLYEHGLDPDLEVFPVGETYAAEKRADGIYGKTRVDFATRYKAYIKSLNNPAAWKMQQAAAADEYQRYLKELAEQGALSYSSGALPQSIIKSDNGHIDRWALIERSLTVQPAQPFFTSVSTLKSLSSFSLKERFAREGNERSALDSHFTKAQDEVTNTMEGMTLDQAKQVLSEFLVPLFAMFREMMGGGDVSALEADAAKDATEQLPEDPEQMKSVTRDQLQALAQASAKKVIAAHAEKTTEGELAAKSFITDAIGTGKRNAQLRQEGKSKVSGFSPNSDKDAIKNFNVNLGAPAPTLLGTIKAMMPGASAEDRRNSGIASHRNELIDSIKAQNPYIGPAGGFTVVQEIRDSILEPLRPEVIAFGLGVRQSSANGAGAVVIQKMTTPPSAFRPGMNTIMTPSNAGFNTITAMLRPIAAEVIVPIQWLETSMPSAEAMIRDQMVKSIALQIDKEIFIGSGDVTSPDTGASIKGILNTAGVNLVDLNAAGRKPGYQDLVNAVTELSIQNVPEDNTNGWAMHPRTRGTFWGMTDNVAQPLWRADVSKLPYPEMVGYRAAVSTQIPINVPTTDDSRSDSSYIFYGRYDMAEYIMANDLAIFVNPYIYSNYLQVQILAYTFSDFILHYPQAFYIMSGVVA